MEQQTITIDPEVAAWLEQQPKKIDSRRWKSNPLIDKKILAGWPVMNKQDLAKALEVSEHTLRKRYRKLMEGK
jgi:hypothetical protein